jgi:hypothetical protein
VDAGSREESASDIKSSETNGSDLRPLWLS